MSSVNLKKPFVLGMALMAIFALGCATSRSQQKTDLVAKETQKLRLQQSKLRAQVEELEHQVLVLQNHVKAYEANFRFEKQKELETAKVPIVHVKPEKKDQDPIELVAHGNRRKNTPAQAARASHRRKNLSSKEIRQQYDSLYLQFNQGDCQDTILKLDQFAKTYPHSSLADNAQYWVAECFFRMKEFRLAIGEFEKVTLDYPKGNKVPFAHLRMGMAFAALGNMGKAKSHYDFLVKQYPGTEAAQKAKSHLNGIERGGS